MWVKVDDGMPEHRKILRAGPMAAWLYVCGLCYCARQLSDGRIPREAVRRMADLKQPFVEAARLVAAGLWEEDGEDFRVHDWLDYQPSRERVQADRRANAERVKRHRNAVTNGERNGVGNGVGNGPVDPIPLRTREREETTPPSGESPAAGPPPPADAGPGSSRRATPVELQAHWNTHLPALPKWREWPKKRAAAARERARERPPDEWRAVIDRVAASSFCRGQNDRGWRADPDWLLRPGTAAKVLEGKYDDREGHAPPRDVRHGRVAAEDTPPAEFAKEGRLAPGEF